MSHRSKYPASGRFNYEQKSNVEYEEITEYLHLLGQLQYLTLSRPDILTAVFYAATKSHSPTLNDYERLLDLVSYLRQTHHYGLTLYPQKSEHDKNLYLTAYVDAAYMSHEDASSHTGYCIRLGPSTPKSFFMSKSSEQKCIATSSTHAEIRALYELTVNIVFLSNLFRFEMYHQYCE